MSASSIRSILCPVDFSSTAEEALRYAVSVGAKLGAEEVHVLHVHQPPTASLPEGTVVLARADEAKQHAARMLEDLCKRYSAHQVSIVPHLIEGVPFQSIVEQARELGTDLVVMGTHGRGVITRFILGSVAERVVRLSSVPVCTVRGTR